MNRFLQFSAAFFTLGSLFMLACDDDAVEFNSQVDEGQISKVRINLIDKPAEQFDAVFVDIQEVWMSHSESDEWTLVSDTESPPGVINLLELTNGKSILLGEMNLQAESISEIRLVLGENNSLVADGKPYELKTPSAQQSGLKIKLNEYLKAGKTNDIILDFDAAQSIVEAGNSGKYILKPVIRPIKTEGFGSIKGKVEPLGTQGLIRMSSGSKSYNTFLDSDGGFTILGLPAGIYELNIHPKNQKKISISGIEIKKNEVTNFGSVTLSGK